MSLVLNVEAYREVCADYRITTDDQAALALGIDRSHATRVRRGTMRPGNGFFGGVARRFGFDAFPSLFIAVPDLAPHRRKVTR